MSDVNSPTFWQTIYEEGDTRWDMGTPTPAFIELHGRLALPTGAMLVPGCGRGYDAIYFAGQGFTVTAVDFAESAVRDATANAVRAGVAMAILKEDIFTVATTFPAAFDYVLEYTCFCAIDMQRREEYVAVMRDALVPGGLFIGLFFPTDNRPGGPPFAVTEEEISAIFSNDFELQLSEIPPNSVTPRRGKEILMIWKKKSSRSDHDNLEKEIINKSS